MAYTRPWDQVLNLLGDRDADEIDDASREAHLDFTERFSSILFDVTADPWKVRTPGVAVDGTFAYNISAHTGAPGAGVADRTNPGQVSPSVAGGNCELFFPVQVVSGAKIRAFSIRGVRSIAGASVQAELWNLNSATGVPTNLQTLALPAGAGIQFAGSGLINHFADQNQSYYIRVNLVADVSGANTAGLLEVRVAIDLSGA
jgi:hypothetical protein